MKKEKIYHANKQFFTRIYIYLNAFIIDNDKRENRFFLKSCIVFSIRIE